MRFNELYYLLLPVIAAGLAFIAPDIAPERVPRRIRVYISLSVLAMSAFLLPVAFPRMKDDIFSAWRCYASANEYVSCWSRPASTGRDDAGPIKNEQTYSMWRYDAQVDSIVAQGDSGSLIAISCENNAPKITLAIPIGLLSTGGVLSDALVSASKRNRGEYIPIAFDVGGKNVHVIYFGAGRDTDRVMFLFYTKSSRGALNTLQSAKGLISSLISSGGEVSALVDSAPIFRSIPTAGFSQLAEEHGIAEDCDIPV